MLFSFFSYFLFINTFTEFVPLTFMWRMRSSVTTSFDSNCDSTTHPNGPLIQIKIYTANFILSLISPHCYVSLHVSILWFFFKCSLLLYPCGYNVKYSFVKSQAFPQTLISSKFTSRADLMKSKRTLNYRLITLCNEKNNYSEGQRG